MPGTVKTLLQAPLKVIYTGALRDFSGYAEAARGYVRALDHVGIDVVADAVSFEPNNPSDLVDEVVGRRLYSLLGRSRDGANLHVIHLTPDNYSKYTDDHRIKAGYFAWETSRLPSKWVNCINGCGLSEVWVPCDYLKGVCEGSGVGIPVYTIPHVISLPPEDWEPNCVIGGLSKDKYKFYSIFQWSERKNGVGIIRAYYEEFSRTENVVLVLKTYRVGNDPTQRDYIRREISKLKRATRGIDCPPILLIEEFLSTSEIAALHYHCDCYVSMARNEGFGIPAFRAAAFGNPVIVPRYSAFPEHFHDGSAYLVDVPTETCVKEMQHISILYTGDMVWGDPSISSCRGMMRQAFNDRVAAKEKGRIAREYVGSSLSLTAVGRIMKARCEALYKGQQ